MARNSTPYADQQSVQLGFDLVDREVRVLSPNGHQFVDKRIRATSIFDRFLDELQETVLD